jgi:hypothetical protein
MKFAAVWFAQNGQKIESHPLSATTLAAAETEAAQMPTPPNAVKLVVEPAPGSTGGR